jgi:serine/threonine-protein kinase
MYAYLQVIAGPEQGRIIHLVNGTTLSIGRGEHSDTRLKDMTMNRFHCALRCDGNQFVLTDTESVSGTFVGGQKIQEHALRHGEEIQAGNTRLKLYVPSSTGADVQILVEAQKSASALKVRTDDGGTLTGKTLSHFELGPVLACGRTGTVYKAHNLRDGNELAVKVLHSEFTRDEEDLKRFVRVMKAAVGLHHSNLIALSGAGKHGESCWYAMEFVEGEPLHTRIKRLGSDHMFDWRYTLALGVQVAKALGALHEKHILHRNISPETVLIRKLDKVAKLGGMELATVTEGTQAKTTTRPGELVGNIAYTAPECTHPNAVFDIRADIYSLGALLYTMLTGKPPFVGKTLVETVAHIRQDDPVPLKKFQDAIPDEFQDAVETMLEKGPEMRFQTPEELAKALKQIAKDQASFSDPNKSSFVGALSSSQRGSRRW